jgi:thioredoxin-related protein
MMKLLLIFFLLTLDPPLNWFGDFHQASTEASNSHKLILVNFSGSDWCIPCMRLRKEILESDVFEKYAAEHLILVRADFPRQKKNQLSKEQIKLNEALAEKYNPDGNFPYTLLMDANGKVLKTWDGYPDETPAKFVEQVNLYNAGK